MLPFLAADVTAAAPASTTPSKGNAGAVAAELGLGAVLGLAGGVVGAAGTGLVCALTGVDGSIGEGARDPHHQVCPYVSYAGYGVASGFTSAVGVLAAALAFRHRGNAFWTFTGALLAAGASTGLAMGIAATRDGKLEPFSALGMVVAPPIFGTLGHELGPSDDERAPAAGPWLAPALAMDGHGRPGGAVFLVGVAR